MLDKSVAITFVNALLDLADLKGITDQVEKDLDLVCDTLTENEKFKKILLHPSITRDDKKDLINKVFGDNVSGLMRNFLTLLVDRRKVEVLELIPMVYKDAIDEKKGILRARVETVLPLPDEQLELLKGQLAKITGKTVEANVFLNPGILGGIVVEIGNNLIDGSVANRLKNLKNNLLGSKAS